MDVSSNESVIQAVEPAKVRGHMDCKQRDYSLPAGKSKPNGN